jgi:hypothetical protein
MALRVGSALAAVAVLAGAAAAGDGPVERFRDSVRGKRTLVVGFHPY